MRNHKIIIEISPGNAKYIWYMIEVIERILPDIGAVYIESDIGEQIEIEEQEQS